MGTKYLHPDALDGGPLFIKNNAVRMLLVKNFSPTDSYATVVGNAVASVTMTAADFTLATVGSARVLTVAGGKSATATGPALGAGNGQDHEIAFTDGSARVLWVVDETAELPDNMGDTINFPSGITLTENQPT